MVSSPSSPSLVERLERLYIQREDDIERWLAAARAKALPFVTTSVDLRHSGARLAPVDTNLYPAGFNNLSQAAELRAARFMRRFMDDAFPKAKKLLIIPENHTRNLPYLDSLLVLKRLCARAGLDARIGSLAALPGIPLELTAASGAQVHQDPLRRTGDRLETEDCFVPDVILLNNDCTSGIPPQLQGLSQPIVPPPSLGWHVRKKSEHFRSYAALTEEFCAAFDLDPWLLRADFHACGQIDFKNRDGLDCLAKAVDAIIARARVKNREQGIAEDPYVFIKADSGTYGMGIMTARDGAEILDINKKERNKMHVIKEGAQVHDVIIQEGIPTVDSVNGKSAEPMIYLIDGVPIGGMYRVNGNRDALGNLNAAGMEFTGMCDESEEAVDCRQPVKECHFRAYGLVAALAALAAGRERY